MTIWQMCIACQIPKATNIHTHTHTHTRYVIHIAFLLRHWLHEHASTLCYVIRTLPVLFKNYVIFAASRHADFANLLFYVCFSLCGSAWKKDIHRNHFLVWSQRLSCPLNMCVQCRLLHLSLTCYKKRKTAEDRVRYICYLNTNMRGHEDEASYVHTH